MTAVKERTFEEPLQMTPRRASWELYGRFLLSRAGLSEIDIEQYMGTKQAVLFDQSPLELIYTGRYQQAIAAIEAFTENVSQEETENEFSGSTGDTAES